MTKVLVTGTAGLTLGVLAPGLLSAVVIGGCAFLVALLQSTLP